MFSATKFVVAGVIVALFGGFLLTGVLTQPSEESVPGVGASAAASARPDSTVEATDPTGEPESAPSADLLPGVHLVTAEVGPGVYRVLSDGEHDLQKNVWNVSVAPDGGIFVEKHNVVGYSKANEGPSPDQRETEPIYRNSRIIQIGEPGVFKTAKGRNIARPPFEDARWGRNDHQVYDVCRIALDGACWKDRVDNKKHVYWVTRLDIDGEERAFTAEDVGLAEAGDQADIGNVQIAGDGTVWVTGDDGTKERFATYGGETWALVPEPPGMQRRGVLAVDPDGVVWLSHATYQEDGPEVSGFSRWLDGSWTTTSFEPTAARDSGWGLTFDPDGIPWIGSLTWFDGTRLRHVQVPSSDANRKLNVRSVAHAPDGSIWIVVENPVPPKQLPCPKSTDGPVNCQGQTDGLYVITPEAVAATE
jgi:hypothetical protein